MTDNLASTEWAVKNFFWIFLDSLGGCLCVVGGGRPAALTGLMIDY
jgi:hypothetical protein